MTPVLFWLAAGCALAYLPLSPRPTCVMRTVLKTLSVALLAVAALLSASPVLLVLALALCAIGDACLSRDGDDSFMAGIAAFAAGHLAYIVLFLSHPNSNLALVFDQPALFWALILMGIAAAALFVPRAEALKFLVLAYIPIILGMGIAVLSLPATGALRWALPAALAFIASDLTLAAEKFLLPTGHPALRITPYLIWVLYWAAQAGFLIAFAAPFATAANPH